MTPQRPTRRRLTASILAAVLTLTTAGQALAGSVQQNTAETLSVLSTATLTGVPASYAYGSGLAGDLRQGPSFTVTASTNNPTGGTIYWQTTDFTRTGGGGTILATARRLQFNAVPANCTLTSGPWLTAPGKAYTGIASTDNAICTAALAGTYVLDTVVLGVVIPAGANPGAYTGTTTIKLIEAP
jgi:hypothetical protein